MWEARPYFSRLHRSQWWAPKLCRQGVLQMRSSRAYFPGLHSRRKQWSDTHGWRRRSSTASTHHGRCLKPRNEQSTMELLFCIMTIRSFISASKQSPLFIPILARNFNDRLKSKISFNGVLHPGISKSLTNSIIQCILIILLQLARRKGEEENGPGGAVEEEWQAQGRVRPGSRVKVRTQNYG